MPRSLALAAVTWLVVNRRPRIAAGVLMCFCGLLRSAEALSLRYRDLIRVRHAFALLLGDTKRGQEQKTLLQEPSVVAWLDGFLLACPGSPEDRVLDCGYTTFQRWLQRACRRLGMVDQRWTSHSLRRGGATALMREGCSWPSMMAFGRWRSARSAREYVRQGEIAQLEAEDAVSGDIWRRLDALAAVGPRIWASPFAA